MAIGGRGAVVDQKALIDALRNNTIFAAGLDVFEDEPTAQPAATGRDRLDRDAEPRRPHPLLVLGNKELGVAAHRHPGAVGALGELRTELLHDPVGVVGELDELVAAFRRAVSRRFQVDTLDSADALLGGPGGSSIYDVIVVDHHKCAPELPPTYALVNPNRLDEADEAAAPSLPGTGVAS